MDSGKIILFLMIMFWTIWLIVKSFDTMCFNMLDSYVTIILLYIELFYDKLFW